MLDDPTIVRMRALDPEGPTIVYDWMPGGTLAERVGKLTMVEIRSIAIRLLSALETLHRNGVVHRDVKPSNILFDPAGQARLGDLGAAHLSDLGATVTGGLVGSLPYIAPEQITGAPVTAATDLYAFGGVIYQMLTGTLAFPGPDFVSQHLGEAPDPVSFRRPALGSEYDAIVSALLAKDPQVRPEQAAQVRRALLSLSWREPDDAGAATPTRATSVPPAQSEEGAHLAPAATPGHWRDTRLGRDVELVRLRATRKPLVLAWAALDSSVLQTVYDVHDDGGDVVAWTEPAVGEAVSWSELSHDDQERFFSPALRALSIDAAGLARAYAVRSAAFGLIVPPRNPGGYRLNTVASPPPRR